MKQRNVLPSQIEQTLLQPDNVTPSFKGRLLARKEFLGNVLEVVYQREKETYIILTAYWLTPHKIYDFMGTPNLEEAPNED